MRPEQTGYYSSYGAEDDLRSLFVRAAWKRRVREATTLGGQIILCWLGIALVIVSLAHAEAPKPKPPRTPGITLILDDADALLLKFAFTVAATGGPDSVVTTVTFTGQPNQRRVYLAATKTDTLSFPRGAQGDSVTATVVATSWKGVDSSKASTIGKTGYRIPVVPAPTISGLKIWPANWILQGGQAAPVCVFCPDDRRAHAKDPAVVDLRQL